MNSELIKDEIWKTVYEARHGDLGTDEATERILEIIRSEEMNGKHSHD